MYNVKSEESKVTIENLFKEIGILAGELEDSIFKILILFAKNGKSINNIKPEEET